MKTLRRFLTILILTLCAAFAFVGCKDDAEEETPASENSALALNYTDCTLNVFDTLQLKIVSGPEGTATWTSEDPAIVTVSDTGLLQGIAPGSALVTVSVGEESVTCDCTVLENSSVPTVYMALQSVDLLMGDDYTVEPAVFYDGKVYDDGVFTFTIADPTVATVDENGKVTAVGLGNTQLIVKASWRQFSDTEYLTLSMPVSVVYDLTAKILQPSLTLYTNAMTKYGVEYKGSDKLTYAATEDGAAVDEEYIVWRSSNEEVATVDGEGVVTAVKAGTAQITVSYENGAKVCQSLPITVTVQKPVVDLTGRRPVLIDAWVDTADFAIGKTTVACDLSTLFSEGYAVTRVTDETSGAAVAYTNGDFTNADIPVGEYVWNVENEKYVVKTGVIVATKVISTTSELMNIQKFGGLYYTEDAQDTETRKYYNYGGYFVLANDLTFTSSDYADDATKFAPTYYHMTSVQKSTVGFTGVFNGLGNRIYDISLSTGGIFGNLAKGSVVKNLNVHNASLNDSWSGVIAHSVSGSVENCSLSARLNNKRQVATVVYLLEGGTLSNVHVTAISGVYGTTESKGNSSVVSWTRGSTAKVQNVSVNACELGTLIESDKANLAGNIIIRGTVEMGEDAVAGDVEWSY